MNKNISFLLLAFLCLNSFGQNCYRLVWSDEFEKNGSPDGVNWGYDLGNSGYGNNEIQNYTNNSENSRIENGILIIEAKKGINGWTSARLKSQGKQSFTFGRIEFRAKLPAGSGTWPALWLLGENVSTAGWPGCGEIDVMEHVGKDPGTVQAALHTPSSFGNTQNKGTISVKDFSTAFHTYAVEWTESKMDFYVDNNLYYTYAPSVINDQTWPFNKPQFIIMNIAMGGNWGSDSKYETGGLKNGIDPSLSSVRMEVDYVRYYTKTEKPKISGTSQVKEGEITSFSVPATQGATYNWVVPSDVTINNGQSTNKIDVTWGASSGNISLTMEYSCGTLEAEPLPVLVKIIPATSTFLLFNSLEANTTKWVEEPTSGNSINLSLVPELEIKYNITNPALFPTIKYKSDAITDLSYYNYVNLSLKTDQINPPSSIRLDIYDMKGNYNSSNIFKITSFKNDDQFHTYSGAIASVWPFSLDAVSELKLYINYGANGKIGEGVIWLKDVTFSKQILKAESIKKKDFAFTIFPNPAYNYLTILPESIFSKAIIYNSSGKEVLQFTQPRQVYIQSLMPGVYTIVVTDIRNLQHSFQFIKQ